LQVVEVVEVEHLVQEEVELVVQEIFHVYLQVVV
jgi:hypothetical protein|tara:strand:- start:596 stop:697 length:102 start_codon:yes stop_codon:yes gene_type:complete